MNSTLENQNIVIIGGSSGVGLTVAKLVADRGAKLTIASRSQERLEKAAQEIGDRVEIGIINTLDENSVKNFFADRNGIEHLLVFAGDSMGDGVLNADITTARNAMESKFWGQFYIGRYGGVKIKPSGSLTFTSGSGPGMNAYFGTLEVARPKKGETIIISGAAGAIGSTVGQIAKILGAGVIGLAGSEEKIRWLQEELGFDLALNYKSPRLTEEIKAACPNGPDLYFDNVGGKTSQTVMWTMRHPARVIECGQISTYNDSDGGWLINIWPIHMNQLRLESFVGYSYAEFFPAGIAQLAYWIDRGKVKPQETEIEGLENAPQAFLGLFRGANVGKMVVKIGEKE